MTGSYASSCTRHGAVIKVNIFAARPLGRRDVMYRDNASRGNSVIHHVLATLPRAGARRIAILTSFGSC